MNNIKIEKSDYGLKAQNTIAWGNALRNGMWGNALRNGIKPPLTPPQGENCSPPSEGLGEAFPLEGGLRGASLATPYASKSSINTKKRNQYV